MSAAASQRAAILAVGDELVAGQQLDTNSAWLAQALAPLGFEVASVTLLGDDREALVARLGDLVAEHALVVLTGGLGPTLDDLTRFAVADCCGVELERDEAVVEGIRAARGGGAGSGLVVRGSGLWARGCGLGARGRGLVTLIS